MKISQREMVLGVATLAAVLGGLLWYIVDRNLEPWENKKLEIGRLKQQVSFHEKAIRMQKNWMDELNELQKNLRVFDKNQPSVSPQLLQTIKNLADRHDLDITRSQPRQERLTKDLYEMEILLTWRGSLEAVVGFLTELQQQGVRYDIRSLKVQPEGRNSESLDGNITIQCAYTRKPVEQEEDETEEETEEETSP